jgi:hypothetical protein
MKKIMLGGRTFAPLVATTLEHDEWITRQRRIAGLHEIVLLEGETPVEAAERTFSDLMSSGSARRILAGFLVPVVEGKLAEWTPELAEDTYRFLGMLAVPSDKSTVRHLSIQMLEDFLKAAPPRSLTFAQSLSRERGRPPDGQPTNSEAGAI